MVIRYRYTEWDGTQEIPPLDPDDILNALTDDLMNFGDLQHALRNLMQRGMRNPAGDRTQGLRDLLQQLRQQRRQNLDRFNLSSAFDDIQKRLEQLLEKERETLDSRLGDATGGDQRDSQDGEQGDGSEGQEGEEGNQGSEAGEQQSGQHSGQRSGTRSQRGQRGQQGGQRQPGQQGQGGEQGSPDEQQFAEMLKNIVERKRNFLEGLPRDLGGQMKELQNYEFMDPDAQAEFQELMEMLKKAMMETFFKNLQSQIANMTPEDMARMKDMIRDLNKMLQERMQGGEPDFDSFMQKYGDLFGDNPPQSLDELVESMQRQMSQMQNLLDSLPSDMRQQLQDLLMDKIADPELRDELADLQANMEFLYPQRDMRNQYPFRGEEEVDLTEAMRLMESMQDMDELERQLERTQYGGEIDDIDMDKLRELLGDEAAETLDELKKFLEILEEAGYIRRRGNTWELTPRGTRKMGQKALGEIYSQLKKEQPGRHRVADPGLGIERSDDSKPYEFGDPFHLHLERTIMNALRRDGAQMPVQLEKGDFEVWKSEQLTQTATVMMVDLSWSMALRGSFQAAKKVAMALQNLISTQFARDSLYIIGFSAYARELKADQLPYVRWDESVLGTNMHHALMLAQNLLAKHKTGTRQIIMISDGEPTAHLERGRSYFAYPPSPITIRETLKEVKRCTQKRITINTFMLDRNYYLKEFVNQMAKMNKGRVFYTTPDRLGEYILVDYVRNKRKSVHGMP
ncbi:MAG TPA: VWA domain-containing protein [Dehalococcoidia bacterium]|nr:VWA domain-containing protein [Dehalococcoidia bacterium]